MATYTYNVSHTSPPGPRVLKFVGAGTGTGSSVVSVTIDGRPFYSGELSWNAPGDVRYVKLGHAIGVVSVTTENTKADGDLIACSGVYTYPETNLPLLTQDASGNGVSLSPLLPSKNIWGWKPIGGSNYPSGRDSQSSSTVSTSRRVYRSETGSPITRFKAVYANAIPNGTTVGELDTTGMGPITISAYLETSWGTIRLRFNGSLTITLQPGEWAETDPVEIYTAPYERVYARTVVTKDAATLIPVTGLNYQTYEGRAFGADVGSGTGMTGLTGSVGDGVFSPIAVIGWTPGDWVKVVGDSITKGVNDSSGPLVPTGLQGVTGWPRRWLYGKANYIVMGFPGGSMSQWSNPINVPVTRSWLARLAPPTTTILAFGANDLMSNPTLATMQAAYTLAAAEERAKGVRRVGIAAILPRTITSDSWATQQPASTSFAAGGLRDQLNTWFTRSGLFDFVLPTPSSVATGAVWTDPVHEANDGCHPLTAGATKIAASMPDPATIF